MKKKTNERKSIKKPVLFAVLILVVICLLLWIYISQIWMLPFLNENYIRNQIEQANYCSVNDDCVEAYRKCSLPCHVFVNKNEVKRINNIVDIFKPTCLDDCWVLIPGASYIGCLNGKCENIMYCNYYCNYIRPLPVPPCINGTTIINGTGTYPNCQCSSKCITTPNTALIPEPYKNPNYCDENIDCGFYRTGGSSFCGNTYYVNATEPEIVFDMACVCNITENKCIILSANK
jgi:hypothetical protein